MKHLKRFIKSLTILFSILIFFQSCNVYRTQNITLPEASRMSNKFKIESRNGDKMELRTILYENGNYYGERKFKGVQQRIKLGEDQITRINPKNKELTVVLNILIPVVFIFGVLLVNDGSFVY